MGKTEIYGAEIGGNLKRDKTISVTAEYILFSDVLGSAANPLDR
ncbi:MAG: hypothetical protein AB1546_11485 [bacterium]